MLIATDSRLPYVVADGSTVSALLRAAAARIRCYGFYQGDWYSASVRTQSPFEHACSVDAALYLSAGCVPWSEEGAPVAGPALTDDRLYVPEIAVEAEEVLAQYLIQRRSAKPVYGEMNEVDSLETIIEWNDSPKRTSNEVVEVLLECAIQYDLDTRSRP